MRGGTPARCGNLQRPPLRRLWADLGFQPAYEVDIDPEFPASGNWGVPEIRFDRRSRAVNFPSRDRLVTRVRPVDAEAWIGSFPADTRGPAVGIYACPSPTDLLAVTGVDTFLVDVRHPSHAQSLALDPVRFVHRPSDTQLLVIGSWIKLAAIDISGLRWVTGRLFLDDLELVETSQDVIVVRGAIGAIPGDQHVLTIDAMSGDLLDGPIYTGFTYPEGDRAWRRGDA